MPRWKFYAGKRSLNQQFDSEVRHHIESLTQDKINSGLAPDQARREAILEFGGPEQVKEELRDIHRFPFLETALTNLRFALRMMRKSRSFSIAVIVTLALGIGANSAVFSAINAILLRPLPFPDSDQLVILRQFDRTVNAPYSFVAPSRLEDWNRLNTTFQAISGYYTEEISDLSGSIPERVTEAIVAGRFFQIWGVLPAIGRDFNASEQHFGGPHAIIISHRLWMHHFNGDPEALGKQLRLEHSSYTVIGVMPANFRFPDHGVDIWEPGPSDAPFAQSRNETWYRVFGRLKAGITISEARANLAAVQAQLGREFPETDRNLNIDVRSLKEETTSNARTSLWILFGAVSLLLLIACVNIAALLLARSTEREREISVRFSLGASRFAVIVQLLTECLVPATIGSALGLFAAWAGSSLFRHFAKGIPRTDEITLDTRIVLYTFACAAITTLLCGLLPALRATRRTISSELANASRTQVSGRHPLQWTLVGTQVALAATLLVGAGLMLRSFQELGRISPGFETSHILTLRISGNYGETTNMKALIARMNHTLDVIRAVPGVVNAATAAALPGIHSDDRTEVKLREDPRLSKIVADSRFVSSGYFAAMQIPVLAGEACHENANYDSVLVNQAFANTYLSGLQPIGRHIELSVNPFGNLAPAITGVAADAHEQGLDHALFPTIYWCASAPFPTPYFLIRTKGSPMTMAETLRHVIHSIEPARSVFGISPLEQHLSDNFAENRLRAVLLTAFALTAIALACTGLYGTLSYLVTIRKREVGLRLALGASRGQIIRRFLFQGVRVSVVGCAAGIGLAISFSQLLAGMLFGITTTDRNTLLSVVLLVLTVAAVASLIPALRASSVEPMQVLREE
jgi:putative ABC transport system permease protein